jgi:hypothetical protein
MAWQLDRYRVGTDLEIKLSDCTSDIAGLAKEFSSGASIERAEKASKNHTSCRELKALDGFVREFTASFLKRMIEGENFWTNSDCQLPFLKRMVEGENSIV